MERNTKNSFKFLIAVLALVLFSHCISREDMNVWHVIGIVVSILVGLWYLWEVFNSK